MKGLGKGVRSFKEGVNGTLDETGSDKEDTKKQIMSYKETKQTFWEHPDVLRGALIKIIVVAILFGLLAFVSKKFSLKLYQHRNIVIS